MIKFFVDYRNLCIDRQRPVVSGNHGHLLGNYGILFGNANRSYFNEMPKNLVPVETSIVAYSKEYIIVINS